MRSAMYSYRRHACFWFSWPLLRSCRKHTCLVSPMTQLHEAWSSRPWCSCPSLELWSTEWSSSLVAMKQMKWSWTPMGRGEWDIEILADLSATFIKLIAWSNSSQDCRLVRLDPCPCFVGSEVSTISGGALRVFLAGDLVVGWQSFANNT